MPGNNIRMKILTEEEFDPHPTSRLYCIPYRREVVTNCLDRDIEKMVNGRQRITN